MPEFRIPQDGKWIVELIADIGFAKSRSEARRLIAQGGVKVDGEPVRDINFVIKPKPEGVVLKVGKRKFAKIKPI